MPFEEDAKAIMSYGFTNRSLETTALESIISVLVTGSAAIGNVLFCIAVCKNSQLRVSRNYFIISLAVSDVIMSLLAMPFSTGVFFMGYWPYGEFMCQFQGTMSTCMGSIALLTLTLTAVNRYFKIIKAPHLYKKLYSKKSILVMITCSWVLGVAVPLPYLLSGNSFSFHAGKAMCYFSFQTKTKAYLVIMMVLLIAVPFSVISICYWKVFWKVRQHSLQVFAPRNELPSELSSSTSGPSIEEIKITKLLITLVLAFTVCWTPFFVVDLISFFRGDYCLPRWTYVLYTNMVALNSSLNPIIYGVMNRQIRRAFYYTCFCCHRRGICRPSEPGLQNVEGAGVAAGNSNNHVNQKKTVHSTRNLDSPSDNSTFSKVEELHCPGEVCSLSCGEY